MSGLTPGAVYTCAVRAANVSGFGLYSAPSSPVTIPVAPGAPSVVSAISTARRATSVVVSPPVSGGGLPITGYQANCVSSNGGVGKSSGLFTLNSPLALAGLTRGASYTCTARARNDEAPGPWSTPSAAFVVQ